MLENCAPLCSPHVALIDEWPWKLFQGFAIVILFFVSLNKVLWLQQIGLILITWLWDLQELVCMLLLEMRKYLWRGFAEKIFQSSNSAISVHDIMIKGKWI